MVLFNTTVELISAFGVSEKREPAITAVICGLRMCVRVIRVVTVVQPW